MSKCFNRVNGGLKAAGFAAFLMILANLATMPSLAADRGHHYAGSLMFGMNPAEAATALGVPLTYVRGRSGDELFLAIPNVKGSALSIRSDGLYLQFRRGRLTGWRGDWGTARPFVIGS